MSIKTINLFVHFQFTSLSPDSQPISVGIVSEDFYPGSDAEEALRLFKGGMMVTDIMQKLPQLTVDILTNNVQSKSFYAEFSDFDLNRCDDWVKENVVGKLIYYGTPDQDKMFVDSSVDEGTYWGSQNTQEISTALYKWLKQFSDYEIQIIVDCGTWDWYHLVQLLAEWDEVLVEEFDSFVGSIKLNHVNIPCRIGLPKLPSNISPVPFDLNDLIAIKKGISPKEAFDIYREELALNFICASIVVDDSFTFSKEAKRINDKFHEKHNALFDAKIIKHIYNKLMNQ